MVKAYNITNAAAGKVAKFLALCERPYKVQKEIARNTCILSNTETKRERGQFHAVDLKPYRTDRHAGLGVASQRGENCSSDSRAQTYETNKNASKPNNARHCNTSVSERHASECLHTIKEILSMNAIRW